MWAAATWPRLRHGRRRRPLPLSHPVRMPPTAGSTCAPASSPTTTVARASCGTGASRGAASMQELLDRGCRADVVAICSPNRPPRGAPRRSPAVRAASRRLREARDPVAGGNPPLGRAIRGRGRGAAREPHARWAPDVVRLARTLAEGARAGCGPCRAPTARACSTMAATCSTCSGCSVAT